MRRIVVAPGEVYGRGTVIREVEQRGRARRFELRCSCGTIYVSRLADLRGRGTQSCGCLQRERAGFEDFVGRRYARLVVLEELPRNPKTPLVRRMRTRCDCGKIHDVRPALLQNGTIRSCGCLQREVMRGRVGPKHHGWKPELTEAERAWNRDRKRPKWALDLTARALARDNWTCQCCRHRGGNFQAHHIKQWAFFKGHRTFLWNLVTLCVPCHDRFHREHGKGRNTWRVFPQWLRKTREDHQCRT